MTKAITQTSIENNIITLRGQRVMMDDGLAKLYSVPTKRLNEQVKRNLSRFPDDFMFTLTDAEVTAMRSQNATASRRNVRHVPTPSPSRALPCWPACSTAREPWR